MSVRPITRSEEQLAFGAPWTNWFALFGATQGVLMHLKFHGQRVTQTWVPTAISRFTLPVFVIGGFAAGATFGVQAFGDAGLRRLYNSHRQDIDYRTEATTYEKLN